MPMTNKRYAHFLLHVYFNQDTLRPEVLNVQSNKGISYLGFCVANAFLSRDVDFRQPIQLPIGRICIFTNKHLHKPQKIQRLCEVFSSSFSLYIRHLLLKSFYSG